MKTSSGLSSHYTILIGVVWKQSIKKISDNKRRYSRKIENLCIFVHTVYTYVQRPVLVKMCRIIWRCSPLKVTAKILALFFWITSLRHHAPFPVLFSFLCTSLNFSQPQLFPLSLLSLFHLFPFAVPKEKKKHGRWCGKDKKQIEIE